MIGRMQTRPLRGNNVRAARKLRESQTSTEQLLWNELRASRLNGLKFRRQHPVGRFVIDFYCASVGLAVEIDGGVHLPEVQRLADEDRQRTLEEQGTRFLRISDEAVAHSLPDVLDRIIAACADSPSPRARGEGVGG